jgi:ATP-dependent DNA helicase RecG
VDAVLKKVRNLTIRQLPSGTLFPKEVSQYDPWVIRETLHNCIAHQDYTMTARINIVEGPETLLYTNVGGFIPGSVESVIARDAPPEQYRNLFLAQAMVNLNMIDTIGSGIKTMFRKQKDRFFPLPDYDLSESERVKVRLFGKILDENYTLQLIENTEIALMDVIALDKVQKKRPIDQSEFARLKSQKLIEGRRPNLFVSAMVAAATGHRTTYIKHRTFDKRHYKKLVVSYLQKFGEGNRRDFEELLLDKLSDALSVEQKRTAVRNPLQELRQEGRIEKFGPSRGPKAAWRLPKPPDDSDV